MNPEALNLALAESFEPKPQEGRPHPAAPQPKCWVQVSDNPPPAGTVSDPWWDFQFGKYSWQPRNFTDPDLVLMLLEDVLHRRDVELSSNGDFYIVDVVSGRTPLSQETTQCDDLRRAIAEAAAKARGVWKEDS